MTSITELAHRMQTLLTRTADELAKATGFVKRQRRISGASFAQAVVLGRLAAPDGTRRQLQQSAGLAGAKVIEQRCKPSAVSFMRALLEAGIQHVITQESELPVNLARFKGVYISDGSRVVWSSGEGLKIGVRLELQPGGLQVCLSDLTTQDQKLPMVDETLPAGALALNDLGFFKLNRFKAWSAQGSYWFTRYKVGTRLTTLDGQPLDLKSLLQGAAPLHLPVRIGTGVNAVEGWLLVAPLPPEERPKRLAQAQSDLACWTLYLTNIPDLSFDLARTRWQIECLFKLWKSEGGLVRSRSSDPIRPQVEGYAKLLGLLIAHWCLLVADWNPDALRLLRTHLTHLRYALAYLAPLSDFFRFVRFALSAPHPANPVPSAPSLGNCGAPSTWLGLTLLPMGYAFACPSLHVDSQRANLWQANPFSIHGDPY